MKWGIRVGCAGLAALCVAPVWASDKEDKEIDPRSIRAFGNHRAAWDGAAPIYYWSNVGKEFEQRELAWVFEQWSKDTPLRFAHEPDRARCEASRRCIKFVLQDKGARCASTIGRQYFVESDVDESSPEYRCAGAIVYVNPSLYCKGGKILGGWMHGAMLHEVGHALGLFHEHQRFDRDEHIGVYPDRIRESGQFDILPISGKSRIDRRNKRKVEMPLSTAWGSYNPRSVMHYWRKHKTNNGLVTLSGAPSLFALHMTKLQGSDVANVMAANFPKSAFLMDVPDYRAKRRVQIDTGGTGLWRLREATHAGQAMATRSMVIPAGVILTVFQDRRAYRYTPGTFETGLARTSQFLFQPAATLYAVPRYNRFLGSLGLGRYTREEIGPGPASVVVGSGLSLRACFSDEGQEPSCRDYSSRAVQFVQEHERLESMELSLAVTLWDDVDFRSRRDNDPRGVESFRPRSDGRRIKYRPKSRKTLSKRRNRSMYVPPGLVAKLCPAGQKSDCALFSNEGVPKLSPEYFDRSIDLRVYPAATLFAGENFDLKDLDTWSLHDKDQLRPIPAWAPGSLVVGPGVELRLCEDAEQRRCCIFSGGDFGARYSRVSKQCSIQPNFAQLSGLTTVSSDP